MSTPPVQPPPKMNRWHAKWHSLPTVGQRSIFILGVAAIVAALLGVGVWAFRSGSSSGVKQADDQSSASASSTTSSSTSSSPSSTAVCATTWKMVPATPANGNWVAQGVPSIAAAKTPEEAQKAAADWLDAIKGTPGLLNGASLYLLHNPVDTSTLVDPHGCATQAAVNTVQTLQAALTLSLVQPDQAPSNATNSGTDNGSVVAANGPGIDGDRSAIKVTMPDGTVVWIMARCGNPVTVGTPPVPTSPKVPTPTPKSTPTPGTTPPSTPSTTPPSTPQCPAGQVGTYPNCHVPTCQELGNCETPQCPAGQIGTYPNCHTPTCEELGNCQTQPPQTCEGEYGPGYGGTYPNCHKTTVDTTGPTPSSVIPEPPSSAPGTNPPPVVVPDPSTPGSTEPTSSQCYDPNTGMPVDPGTPGAWCS